MSEVNANDNENPKVFWTRHIDSWRKSGQTQADYCGLNGISASSFSKWKKKLKPRVKSGASNYDIKNDYSKNTKLSNRQYEALIQAFFTTDSLKVIAQITGITTKTISKTFDDLTAALVDGAVQYPHLFFGSGTLLLLCPPPDIEERMLKYQNDFPYRIFRYRDESTNKGRLRNNIEMIFRLLMGYAVYRWTPAETFLFREVGFEIYYKAVYAPEQSINPDTWSLETHYEMAKEVNPVFALIANMNHWALNRNNRSYLSEEQWSRIFRGRHFSSYDDSWATKMATDLKWVLQHKRLGSVQRQRNTYWDEFAPSEEATFEAKRVLNLELQI